MNHYLLTYYNGVQEEVTGYNFLMAISSAKGRIDEIVSVIKLEIAASEIWLQL